MLQVILKAHSPIQPWLSSRWHQKNQSVSVVCSISLTGAEGRDKRYMRYPGRHNGLFLGQSQATSLNPIDHSLLDPKLCKAANSWLPLTKELFFCHWVFLKRGSDRSEHRDVRKWEYLTKQLSWDGKHKFNGDHKCIKHFRLWHKAQTIILL